MERNNTNTDRYEVEWDEDGCRLWLHSRGQRSHAFRIEDPEALYDAVKAAILPWLMERDEALREYRLMSAAVEYDAREAYDRSDPKHPDWHSVHADIWDMREGK